MKKIVKKLQEGLDFVDKTLMVLLASSATILVFVSVIARYVFKASLVWASELTTYLFIWMTLFGASYGFEIGMHMSFDALVKALPAKLCKAVTILSRVVVLLFLILLAYLGVQLVEFDRMAGQVSINLQIPFWIIYLVVPITMATASWRTMVNLVDAILTPAEELKKRTPSELEEMEKERFVE